MKIWNRIKQFSASLFSRQKGGKGKEWKGFYFPYDDPHKALRALFPHIKGDFRKPAPNPKGYICGRRAHRIQRRALGFPG